MAYLQFMTDLGLEVEVVVDQLQLEAGIVCNEGIVPGHAVVQVCYTLVQILHLPLHHLMPAYHFVPHVESLCGQMT